MGWFTPRSESVAARPVEALWSVCPSCKGYVSRPGWDAAARVCPRCNYHDRLSCRERLDLLVDAGSFHEINAAVSVGDPLSFRDATGSFADKAKAAVAKTGIGEAVVTGRATIEGIPVVVGIMDFRFLGGSLGSGTGERILLAAEESLRTRKPYVLVSASGGARMHEGIVSLMQMAKTCAGIARLHAARIPYLSILTDPTTGGVSASYAMVGDLNIAEPRSLIGFAGRRVIEQTIKQKLPDDFQTAEYVESHGFVDAIVARRDLRGYVAKVLRYAHPPAPAAAPAAPTGKPAGKPAHTNAWEAVQLARHAERPLLSDYIAGLCDEFLELHGDRAFADDRAMMGGFATIGGERVMLIGHRKGRHVEENIASNFGMANPDGYRKAMRLMKLAEKYGLPVVSFIDTPGAYPGLEAEARGQAEAIARNLTVMADLRTPFLVVVTGEGGSGGALGIGVGDTVLMLQNAIYSVISPEGCASILWRDGKKAPEAAEAMKITADSLLELGVIDRILPEPEGGAHADPGLTIRTVKAAILEELPRLRALSPDDLVRRRYEKYASMGRKA